MLDGPMRKLRESANRLRDEAVDDLRKRLRQIVPSGSSEDKIKAVLKIRPSSFDENAYASINLGMTPFYSGFEFLPGTIPPLRRSRKCLCA
jgi:hypothetical protein